ncbi:MAG: phosphoribosylanthranilate isomerase [Acidiphilium sp.]|nr:phosphoribosylanthranilate isomerase [Acidiphilium sp.]MDD4934584.1 phosphoribosylanthranilate isomerase [Acidiphilium sp.]
MALVKICGINTVDAYRAAVGAGADWVGFVFFPPSPRYVTAAQAHAIGAEGVVTRVGLFVDPDEATIAAVTDEVKLDILQLYAPANTCRALRARFGLPVWRAVGVAIAADLPTGDEGLDGFIIESRPPPDAARPGGNATALDWSITKSWRAPAPWLLAGGLTPDNVARAIAASGAGAVDVSSGVEDTPGQKSAALIREFIAAAKF